MFNKQQLLAVIVLVSLFLLASSVLAVVLNHRSKLRTDSSEDATEKLRVTSSTLKTVSLECAPKYRGYCLNGGKCVRLTDPLVVPCRVANLYMVAKGLKNFYVTLDRHTFLIHQILLWLTVVFYSMSLLLIDRFWNSSTVQTTLLQIPPKTTEAFSKDVVCLSYHTNNLIQLISVVNLHLIKAAFLHWRCK